MLVPCLLTSNPKNISRRAVEIGGRATEAEQQHLYKELLKMPWLPDAIRRPILVELGTTLREEKRNASELETMILGRIIEARERGMKGLGPRSRVGRKEAAKAAGVTLEALKKRRQRAKLRAKEGDY
jgi:hypothetical protein